MLVGFCFLDPRNAKIQPLLMSLMSHPGNLLLIALRSFFSAQAQERFNHLISTSPSPSHHDVFGDYSIHWFYLTFFLGNNPNFFLSLLLLLCLLSVHQMPYVVLNSHICCCPSCGTLRRYCDPCTADGRLAQIHTRCKCWRWASSLRETSNLMPFHPNAVLSFFLSIPPFLCNFLSSPFSERVSGLSPSLWIRFSKVSFLIYHPHID